jgi:hypothetical protein
LAEPLLHAGAAALVAAVADDALLTAGGGTALGEGLQVVDREAFGRKAAGGADVAVLGDVLGDQALVLKALGMVIRALGLASRGGA